MKRQLLARLREPSTWAGLAAICGSAAAVPGPASPYLLAAAGLFGGVATIMSDPKPKDGRGEHGGPR